MLSLNAQVKIGDNHDTIHPDAILELESTDKGLLLPRIALSSSDNPSPFSESKAGMVVYNTVSAGSGATAVTPGLYISNGSSWQKMVASSSAIPGAPVGSVISMAANSTPTGYLVCDGSVVSRTTYSDLFAIIGTTYGAGDGSTTFNLPDYRGYFLRGFDNGAGNDPDASSRTGGDAVGSLQNDEIKSHNHSFNLPRGDASWSNGGGNSLWGNSNNRAYSSENTGGNETRPKNISVLYCIKYTDSEYQGADGANGADGTNGTDGKTLLNGSIDPTTEGNDGDFYINTNTHTIFGPKSGGAWGSGTALQSTTFDDVNQVGSLITSLLNPTQFYTLHSSSIWQSADGSDVTGSDYHTLTGNTNVPGANIGNPDNGTQPFYYIKINN